MYSEHDILYEWKKKITAYKNNNHTWYQFFHTLF